MSPEQQRIRCAVRAVGDGIERSNFCFIHFKSIKKASAHPLHYIEDERCGYSYEISENLCDAMISS